MAEYAKPINLKIVSEILPKVWNRVMDVRVMGSLTVIICFATKEAMEEALSSGLGLVNDLFSELRPCSKFDWCYSRSVWLERRGLSPSAWSTSNLRKIGEVWGYVIGFDENALNGKSFSVAKIHGDACIKHFIKGWIFLLLVMFLAFYPTMISLTRPLSMNVLHRQWRGDMQKGEIWRVNLQRKLKTNFSLKRQCNGRGEFNLLGTRK